MTQHREGKKRVFDGIEFFACNGMVRMHDRRDGTWKDLSLSEAQDRARQLAGAIARISSAQPDGHKQKYKLSTLANEMEEVAREAADMGDPLDPKVQAFHARHKSWKKPTVQVPGMPGVARRPSGLLIAGNDPDA